MSTSTNTTRTRSRSPPSTNMIRQQRKTNELRSRSKSPSNRNSYNNNDNNPASTHSQQLKRGRRPPTNHDNRGRNRSVSPQIRPRSRSRARSMDPASNQRRARSMSPTTMKRGRNKNPSGRRGADRSLKTAARGRSVDRIGGKEYPIQQHPLQKQKKQNRSQRLYRSLRSISEKKELTWCKLTQYIIPIFIMICASVGLVFATGNGTIITDTLGGFINSELDDPYSDGEAPHWPQDGKGLKAKIINELSDEWQTSFALAIADWNDGQPDAVDIFEEIGTYTPNCEAPDGKIIVCNGDYGETKWRGINEAITDYQGEIVSTTARMNDYYLSKMDSGAWQYTMCHELGHALGLGHTDEDFDNEDLGNCMDYTNNLDFSKHPDTMNYETLLLLYGPISGQRRQMRMRMRKIKDTHHHNSNEVTAITITLANKNTDTSDMSLPRHDTGSSSSDNDDIDIAVVHSTVPDHIRTKKKEVVEKLLNDRRDDGSHNFHERDGWKLIHRKLHGEEYEIYLGEGYKVRIQLLLV